MNLEIHVIDAFTTERFKGNSAAVIVLDQWLADDLMASIAFENNLSETAFVVPQGGAYFEIRWFSPITEIAFCGHATLAASYVVFEQNPGLDSLVFLTRTLGEFPVSRSASGDIVMNFPNTKPQRLEDVPEDLIHGLSIAPSEVFVNHQAYFVIYESEAQVLAVTRNNEVLARLKPRDVVVTCRAESDAYDFMSRYFWPANGGDEDPVTGSIHTGLAPFWAERLGRLDLLGYQASKRGGLVRCCVADHRVIISGRAVRYLRGVIEI